MNLLKEFDILASIKNWKPIRLGDLILWTCDHPGYYMILDAYLKFITPSVYYTKEDGGSTIIINGQVYVDFNSKKNMDKISFPGFTIMYGGNDIGYTLIIRDEKNKLKYHLTRATLFLELGYAFYVADRQIKYY